MNYSPGDEVHVETFGRGVVREVRNGGRYVVEVKGRSMIVAADRLSAIAPGKKKPRPASAQAPAGIPESLARQHAATSLDLHGMTVEEALSAFDAFLDDGIRAGAGELRVVHGRSGGRLKSAIHARLRALPSIRSFRIDPANPGVTIVSL